MEFTAIRNSVQNLYTQYQRYVEFRHKMFMRGEMKYGEPQMLLTKGDKLRKLAQSYYEKTMGVYPLEECFSKTLGQSADAAIRSVYTINLAISNFKQLEAMTTREVK